MKAIKYYTLSVILFLFADIKTADAVNITCTGTLNNTTYTVTSTPVVLGHNIPDYTLLWSAPRAYTITTNGSCSAPLVNYWMTMSDFPAGSISVDRVYAGKTHKIYPTTISGLGISIFNEEGISSAADRLAVPAWPAKQFVYTRAPVFGLGNWFGIYLWKIPGDLPVSSGALTFTGPTIYSLLTPVNAADTISSTTLPELPGGVANVTWATTRITGSLNLQTGTCDIQGGNRVVRMGTYDVTSYNDKPASGWVDSSFTLSCPDATGYGGTVDYTRATLTANNVRNNPIEIKIVPRTAVVDASRGILALNAGGAEGYGLQLAWGDHTTLGSGIPTRPVQLNTATLASSLNSAYSATPYAIGATAISNGRDGTIRMAARYIRTSGAVQPGPANATVEIIASYQ